MPALKERAKTLIELADSAAFYVRRRPLPLDGAAVGCSMPRRGPCWRPSAGTAGVGEWKAERLEAVARAMPRRRPELGRRPQPIRAALTGSTVSPPIFAVMEILGAEETWPASMTRSPSKTSGVKSIALSSLPSMGEGRGGGADAQSKA
jgi:glutamyl-tRNA synthetase